MDTDIKILIRGKTGSGKSTLAAAITSYLREQHMQVSVVDEDIQDENTFLDRLHNVENIKSQKIKIITQQVNN